MLTSSSIPWERIDVYDKFVDELKTSNNVDESSLNAIEMGYFAHGANVIVSGGKSKGYRTLWYDPYSHVYTVQNYGNFSTSNVMIYLS